MTAWLAIIIVASGSYLFRLGGLNIGSRAISGSSDALLGHVTAAALGAIVAGSTLTTADVAAGRLGAEHIAIACAILVVRRTGNLLHGVMVGMPIIWLVTVLA
jgi:branched-subunit amino acid transport protein